jgi:hypothetical protein
VSNAEAALIPTLAAGRRISSKAMTTNETT